MRSRAQKSRPEGPHAIINEIGARTEVRLNMCQFEMRLVLAWLIGHAPRSKSAHFQRAAQKILAPTLGATTDMRTCAVHHSTLVRTLTIINHLTVLPLTGEEVTGVMTYTCVCSCLDFCMPSRCDALIHTDRSIWGMMMTHALPSQTGAHISVLAHTLPAESVHLSMTLQNRHAQNVPYFSLEHVMYEWMPARGVHLYTYQKLSACRSRFYMKTYMPMTNILDWIPIQKLLGWLDTNLMLRLD